MCVLFGFKYSLRAPGRLLTALTKHLSFRLSMRCTGGALAAHLCVVNLRSNAVEAADAMGVV